MAGFLLDRLTRKNVLLWNVPNSLLANNGKLNQVNKIIWASIESDLVAGTCCITRKNWFSQNFSRTGSPSCFRWIFLSGIRTPSAVKSCESFEPFSLLSEKMSRRELGSADNDSFLLPFLRIASPRLICDWIVRCGTSSTHRNFNEWKYHD